jgi:hypothetical protein
MSNQKDLVDNAEKTGLKSHYEPTDKDKRSPHRSVTPPKFTRGNTFSVLPIDLDSANSHPRRGAKPAPDIHK